MKPTSNFAKYSWFVLAYTVMVILWGAFVRATGSGAGCGSHWPLCNGVVVPHSPQVATIIEFTHRMTSGLSLILVVVLFIWGLRRFPAGSPVRKGVSLSLIFILTEALVGAGLVLFEWVASDASTGRVISTAVHLLNTFLLLASLTMTAWWASGGEPVNLHGHGASLWLFGLGFGGVILLAVSGAITALGDTLFPSASLVEGIRQDFAPMGHFLLRLRVWHPVFAITVGFYMLFLSGLVAMFRVSRTIRIFAGLLAGAFVLQLGAGLLNLFLLAPVWMQIIPLLFADTVWILLVLLALNHFAESEISQNVELAPNWKPA